MVVFSLTLVRHGETVANKHGVIQGHQDTALSDVGLEQARLVAIRLQNDKFTHIFASDLSRAAKTAQTIAEANAMCHCSVQLDKRLRERKFGEFEGKTFKELYAAAQRNNRKWPDFIPNGAETYKEVRFRAQAFFKELCELMAKASSPVDRIYIPTSLKDKRSHNSGLSNGITFVTDNDSPCNVLPNVNKSDTGGASQNKSSHTQPLDEVVALKRPRKEDTHLHRLSLDGLDPSSKTDRDYEYDSIQGAGITTMARSNSSSSSGCSSLHDSIESPEADVDLNTATEEEAHIPSMSHNENVKTIFSSVHPTDRVLNMSNGQIPAKGLLDSSLSWFRDTDWCPVLGHSVASSSQGCPNVSLSPLLEHRLTSISSVSSGRNSSFDDADIVPAVAGEVLVVSHGGLIKELVAHFIEDFNCKIPGGKGHALRVCPNTGVSRFMVTLDELEMRPTVTCLLIHDKDHLNSVEEILHESNPAV